MRPPIIISHASYLPTLLRFERIALGMSGEELDWRVGWADRYSAKCESPEKAWGKTVFGSRCSDEWLAGLGRALVLMDRAVALALPDVRFDPPPSSDPSPPTPTPTRYIRSRWTSIR